jgi:hypothetical protein
MKRFAMTGMVMAALAVAACSSSPPPMTVHGTVEVAVQDYSEFASYTQIQHDNTQVTVTDPSGKVIAVTTAADDNVAQGPSVPGDLTLTVGFTVKVPQGLSFYGITVTGGGNTPVQFTQAQMQQGPAVCIGNACSSG